MEPVCLPQLIKHHPLAKSVFINRAGKGLCSTACVASGKRVETTFFCDGKSHGFLQVFPKTKVNKNLKTWL